MSEKRTTYDTYIEHPPKGTGQSFLYYAPAGFLDNWRCGASDEATLKGGRSDGLVILAVARGVDHILVPQATIGLQKYIRSVDGDSIIFRYEEPR